MKERYSEYIAGGGGFCGAGSLTSAFDCAAERMMGGL